MPGFNNHENWNEFRWEKEIRRDERRISCYFRELPGWIDLPGEEEAIFDSLMSFPGLVPSEAEAAGALRIRELFADEDGDGETEPPPRRNGSDLVEQVDKLAVEWNVLASSLLPDFMAEEGIAVSCGFGKLLARVADMIDAEDTPALRVSLAKRAAADINGLIGDLRHVTDQCPAVVPQVSLLEEFLQHLRERIIDFLNAARKTMKS